NAQLVNQIEKNVSKKEEPVDGRSKRVDINLIVSRKQIKQIKKMQIKELKDKKAPLFVRYSQQLAVDKYRLFICYVNTNCVVRKVVPATLVKEMTLNINGIVHDGCTCWPPNLVYLNGEDHVVGVRWTNPLSKQEAGMAKYVQEYFGYHITSNNIYKI
ncbi:hypothetical protein HDV02_005846, partial [Globomyces sp. JEL0801]